MGDCGRLCWATAGDCVACAGRLLGDCEQVPDDCVASAWRLYWATDQCLSIYSMVNGGSQDELDQAVRSHYILFVSNLSKHLLVCLEVSILVQFIVQ